MNITKEHYKFSSLIADKEQELAVMWQHLIELIRSSVLCVDANAIDKGLFRSGTDKV